MTPTINTRDLLECLQRPLHQTRHLGAPSFPNLPAVVRRNRATTNRRD